MIYRTTLKTPLLISALTGNAIIVGIDGTNCCEANTCGEMLIFNVLSSQFAQILHILCLNKTNLHLSIHTVSLCSWKPSFWSVFRRNATSNAAFSRHVEVIAGCTLKTSRRIWSVLRCDLSNYPENPTFDQSPDWKCYSCRNRCNELLWSQHV